MFSRGGLPPNNKPRKVVVPQNPAFETGGGADQRLYEGGYGQWDARVSYDMELANGGTLGLSAYGRNLSDEEWREQALFLGGFRTGFQGWGAPRLGFFEIKYSM